MANHCRGVFERVVNKHATIKRKRVCEQDIPYKTRHWKNVLRIKRKYARKFAKRDSTNENLKLDRKYRNLATRERRKAIRAL